MRGLRGLGANGMLKVTVQLISGRDPSYIIESHTTRGINWPRVVQWEEVVSLKPDALDDEIVLQLSHSENAGPLSFWNVVGEARTRVYDINNDIVQAKLSETQLAKLHEARSHPYLGM